MQVDHVELREAADRCTRPLRARPKNDLRARNERLQLTADTGCKGVTEHGRRGIAGHARLNATGCWRCRVLMLVLVDPARVFLRRNQPRPLVLLRCPLLLEECCARRRDYEAILNAYVMRRNLRRQRLAVVAG